MSVFQGNNEKTINNRKCIGPCYPPGTQYYHPLTLTIIQDNNYNTCAVDPYTIIDEDGNKVVRYHDICSTHLTNTKNNSTNFASFVTPYIEFNPDYFLSAHYGINSFDNGLDWIDSNVELMYITKERVFDMLMLAYGNELNVADHRYLNHVQNIMLHYIDDISEAISGYIDIVDGEIKYKNIEDSTSVSSENDVIDNNALELNNFIVSKMLNDNEIAKFNSKIIRYYGNTLNETNNISYVLVGYMIDYIIKRIKLTLNV